VNLILKSKRKLLLMNKLFDDSNWREEYKGMKVLNSRQIELLENGPDSLAASWSMQAMKNDWKKKKGYKDPEPPDCQSSFKQWEDSIGSVTKES